MTDFVSLPEKVKANLARLSDSVSNVVPIDVRTWTIHTNTLDVNGPMPGVISEVKEWYEKEHIFLYTFKIISSESEISDVYDRYKDLKERIPVERAYAKLGKISEYLYVGSSRSIHIRLKDHLGFGHRKTWAMHLAYWINSLDLELRFECAKYPPDTPDIAKQLLEDALWDELQPMLGKRGAKF